MRRPFEFVDVRREGGVSIVAMDRAAKRNAMNEQLLLELRAALRQEQECGEVRAVVLTGHGSVFSAGADRAPVAGLEGEALARAFAPLAVQLAQGIAGVMLQLVSMSKPVVCAVNGHAAGGAMITVLGCDYRVASQDAQFWMPEVTMGRAIGEPSMDTLLACAGPLVSKDIVLTGRRIDAGEMVRLGLLNRVVPGDEVLSAARDAARNFAEREPQVLATVKARANATLVDIWRRHAVDHTA